MKSLSYVLSFGCLLMLSGLGHGQVLIGGNNLSTATAIMGVSSSISDTGSSYGQHDRIPEVADGNLSTNETTYYTGNPDSYVGFTFATPMTVNELTVNFNTYPNGGWFGNASAGNPANNSTPLGGTGAGGVAFLSEPTIQVLFNHATTWTTVADSSTYLTVMSTAHTGMGSTPTVDFTLDTPVGDVIGIRVIGATGGSDLGPGNDDPNGFLGVAEENAFGSVPEPSTYAMMLGGLAFLAFCIGRKSRT